MSVSPVRIVGAGQPPGRASGAGLVVEFHTADGQVWDLYGDHVRSLEAFLAPDALDGLQGLVEWDRVESVGRFGVRKTGPRNFRVPGFDFTLRVTLRAFERGGLPDVARRWFDAWSFAEPGRLVIRSDYGTRWAWVESPGLPSWPNSLADRRVWEMDMGVSVPEGHLWGDVTTFVGGHVQVRAGGDAPLNPWCQVWWDGRATTVTLPHGQVVDLPPVGSPRVINLDRGMSGQVTHEDGVVDTAVWSALRGMVQSVTLSPGGVSSWHVGPGVELRVTPRFLSPWGVRS